MTASPVLTLREAMAYLKRGRSWMLDHADAIGVIRDGGRLSFYEADLRAWLDSHRRQTAALRALPPTKPTKPSQLKAEVSVLTGRPFREVAR